VRDHPGGADLLIDVAGTDATAAYEDVGHSEDADEILQTYLIGTLKDAREFTRSKTVRVIQSTPQDTTAAKPSRSSVGTAAIATGSCGSAALWLYLASNSHLNIPEALAKLSQLSPRWFSAIRTPHGIFQSGGFSNGFITATLLCAAVSGVIGVRLSKFAQIESGFARYPPHMESHKVARPNPHLAKGFLEPKEYKQLPLIRKDPLSPNVYRFIFQLPGQQDVIGLPIGQHVAIKATIKGQSVSRSYTPTSNNLDYGRLELVIKCYPDGVLTGQYLANLNVGDRVLFRGPKGAMRYSKGLCNKIGMIAGGTGITPMYQLIRAICEDDTDTTEVSLIYANRTEDEILLREELETFAQNYPKNFKLWYMLDNPPQKWDYGKGYVTPAVMAKRLPGPSTDTKVMLCGHPPMVNASKKALVSMGFKDPGAVTKMTDQIFCF
jgi:cytochrome-b5 reductase